MFSYKNIFHRDRFCETTIAETKRVLRIRAENQFRQLFDIPLPSHKGTHPLQLPVQVQEDHKLDL